MGYCGKCGASLPDGANVCPKCGQPTGNGAGAPNPYMGQGQSWGQPVRPSAPAYQLKTNRGLLKFILLSAITFGIYGLVVMSSVSTDINTIAQNHDGKKTMHYLLVVFIFSWLTFGIVPLVWYHRLSARIGDELGRRGISYSFGAGSFWGWCILGSLLCFVGPLVYMYKLLHAMNLLSEHYNTYGA
ncbi:MAG: DUF4234 domain-containing protein [Eubacteriales bacterium]|nr:DUF4234 domain-containing protein [Eubacteriales bacterium]